jgi:hypothetical protein
MFFGNMIVIDPSKNSAKLIGVRFLSVLTFLGMFSLSAIEAQNIATTSCGALLTYGDPRQTGLDPLNQV